MGRNLGKVTAIHADRIIVTEEYRTMDGEIVVNPITLKLFSIPTE